MTGVVFFPVTIMNQYVVHDHFYPSSPSRSVDILRWNISGAEEISNGSLQMPYRPNGVMMIVKIGCLRRSGFAKTRLQRLESRTLSTRQV